MEIIRLEDIKFSYNGNEIIRGISYCFGKGSFTAVMGPNGSGKTTLIRLINGILKPAHGDVLLKGKQIKRIKPAVLAREMAYVPQMQMNTFPATVFDSVMLGRKPYIRWNPDKRDKEITSSLLVKFGLDHIALKDINRLSSGQRQRVFIARALAQEPDIIMLDEPTANLDLQHQHEVMSLLRELAYTGLTIVIAIHDINLALKYCTAFMLLNEGRMADHGGNDIISEEVIEEIYKVRVHIIKEKDQIFVLPLSPVNKKE